MKINELKLCDMNKGLAYILGLIYPLYKEKQLNDKTYILGSVNHNPGKITSEELTKHYFSVMKLINENMKNIKPDIKSNKTSEYKISVKEGFTVLIDKNDLTSEECRSIITSKVNLIKDSPDELKKEFVKGCFDGRSSFDTTAHYLSIDVDRDYNKQNLIADIIKSLDISVNINKRDTGHKKNDQIRIRKDSLEKFIDEIGLYSICRQNIIEKAIRG